jgi:hypothetical protein
MERRVSIVVGSLIASMVVSACSLLHPREPVYEGKKLSAWMVDLNRQWTEETQFAEVTARMQKWTNVVEAVGTNGLPVYLRYLQESPRLPTTYGAQVAVQILGPRAAPAIPDLVRLLHKEESAFMSACCLEAIGPDAVPALIDAVGTTTNRGRDAAIMVLGELGPSASSASEALIHVINTDPQSAEGAMRAIVELETNTAVLLPLLADHACDTNNGLGAMHALGRIGRPGYPILIQSLTNDHRSVRCFAQGALDPEFEKLSWGNPDVPPFRTLTCIYNLKALSGSWRAYSQGDFRVAMETAARFTNDVNAAIRIAASNAVVYLAPIAATNIPQMKLDEENRR